MNIKTVGSVCSGIEAASVAWQPLGLDFEWFSEIEEFPSSILKERFPDKINVGDMNNIPDKLINETIASPDLICGGTPCQAFSLAGLKKGLSDDRGNLTLKFVDIIESNDKVREKNNLEKTIVFWENVEGVLSDKTNAFGCLVSSLAGLDEIIPRKKWPNAGIIYGPSRNVAWRVLDAKYFGLPQQRRRLYLLAGGTSFHPENILFELHQNDFPDYPEFPLSFTKGGHNFEIFREYTDCLYSAYGTKWNGNAAARNGSLFVVQDKRIRRLSPLETERLMGFPDNYTDVSVGRRSNRTSRYKATGNSWVVPVIKWFGERLIDENKCDLNMNAKSFSNRNRKEIFDSTLVLLNKELTTLISGKIINCSPIPENPMFGTMEDILSPDAPEKIYLSPVGCYGIVRRADERNAKINSRLREVLLSISSEMSEDEIEKRSKIQKRGTYSQKNSKKEKESNQTELSDFK